MLWVEENIGNEIMHTEPQSAINNSNTKEAYKKS